MIDRGFAKKNQVLVVENSLMDTSNWIEGKQ